MSSPDSRARVLDAALRLIRKRGDAAVTMAQIAKAARLSRQAVYSHFADRADLMVALARHVNESLGLTGAEIQRIANTLMMRSIDVALQRPGRQSHSSAEEHSRWHLSLCCCTLDHRVRLHRHLRPARIVDGANPGERR